MYVVVLPVQLRLKQSSVRQLCFSRIVFRTALFAASRSSTTRRMLVNGCDADALRLGAFCVLQRPAWPAVSSERKRWIRTRFLMSGTALVRGAGQGDCI